MPISGTNLGQQLQPPGRTWPRWPRAPPVRQLRARARAPVRAKRRDRKWPSDCVDHATDRAGPTERSRRWPPDTSRRSGSPVPRVAGRERSEQSPRGAGGSVSRRRRQRIQLMPPRASHTRLGSDTERRGLTREPFRNSRGRRAASSRLRAGPTPRRVVPPAIGALALLGAEGRRSFAAPVAQVRHPSLVVGPSHAGNGKRDGGIRVGASGHGWLPSTHQVSARAGVRSPPRVPLTGPRILLLRPR